MLPPNRTPQRTPRTMRDTRPIQDDESPWAFAFWRILALIAVVVAVGWLASIARMVAHHLGA